MKKRAIGREKRDKEEGETKKRWIGREKSKMGCGVWRG